MMSGEAAQLPRIDFSGVDPSAPGAGTWSAVRAQVMDAFANFGCFHAHYPSLTPELRAALFDGAVRPLFALPVDSKRRNDYGLEKPFLGYLGELQGLDRQESLAIVDAPKPEAVRAFGEIMWPNNGGDNACFCETVHGVARRIAELEEAVRRMVLEGLGVAKHHEALNESTWHLFRMWEYKASAKKVRHPGSPGPHQDTNALSLVCQHEVEGVRIQSWAAYWAGCTIQDEVQPEHREQLIATQSCSGGIDENIQKSHDLFLLPLADAHLLHPSSMLLILS